MGGGLPAASSSGQVDGKKDNGRMLLDATAGAVAGCVARFVTGPLDVIKIRFQVQLEPIASMAAAPSKYTGFFQAFGTILKEEGVQGLWRGTVPGLLLTVPYTAVQFVALQQVKDFASKFGLTGANFGEDKRLRHAGNPPHDRARLSAAFCSRIWAP